MKQVLTSLVCILAMAGIAVANDDAGYKVEDSGAFIEINGEIAPLKAMPLGVEPKIQMESHEQSNAKGNRGICDFRMVCNDANQEKVWYINDVPDFSPATYNTLKMVVRGANYRRVSMEIWLNTPNGWYVATINNAMDIWCLYTIGIGGIPVNITHIALAISESSGKQGENEVNFHYLQLDYMEIRNSSSVFWSHEFSSASGWSYFTASSVGAGEYSFTARTVEDVFTYVMITGTSANTSWSKAFQVARSYAISDTIFRDEYFADGAHYIGFMYMVDNANYFVKALNTNGKAYTDVKNEIQGFPAIVAVSQGLDQYAQDIMPAYAESQVSAGHAVIYHEQNVYKNQQSAIAIVGNNTTGLNEATEIFAPLMKEAVKAMPVAMNNTSVQNEIAPAARDNTAMDNFNLAMDLIAAKSEATLGVAAAYAKSTGPALSAYDTRVLNTYLKVHVGILMAIPLAVNAMQIKEGYATNDPAKIKSGSAAIIDMGVGTAFVVKTSATVAAVAVAAGVTITLPAAAAIAVGAAVTYTAGNMVLESTTGNSIGGHVYNAASYVKSNTAGVPASIVNSSTAVSNVVNSTQTKISTAVSSASTTAKTVYNTAATAVSTAVNTAVNKVTNVASGVKKWLGIGDYFYEDYNTTLGLHSVYILASKGEAGVVASPEGTGATSMLGTCAPNPATTGATISFNLAEPANASLKIYNINGQLVKTLVNESKPVGYHSVKWDGKDERGNKVAAGVYLYRMQAGDYSKTNKMTVLR